jgi:SAM-dependent methyltransferase
VGSSEGAFLDCLTNEKLDFAAIDIDEEAINFCRERGFGDRVTYGSMLDIPFDNNSFDIVTALDVVEHVSNDKKALSEMKRVCRPKGIILLMLPAHPWLWSNNDLAYHHYRRYDQQRIKMLAKYSNLQIRNLLYFNIIFFPFFVILSMTSKIIKPKKSPNVLKSIPRPLNSFLSRLMDIEIGVVRRNAKMNRKGLIGGTYVVVLRKSK